MEPKPQFSIVTPSFGQLQWLPLCLASVADQTEVSSEHLVQDGGSGADLEAVLARFPNVHGVSEPDNGMYDALNRGLRRARGELLAWLNCDEQYLPRTLQKVHSFFAERHDVDVLFGDAILVDLCGRALSYRRVITPQRSHTRLDHLGTLSCATFFRRSVIDRGFFFDTKWRSIGDAVWIDALLRARVPMACMREPLSVYAFTGTNLSASARAHAEMRSWRESPDAPSRFLRFPAVLWHRIRKTIAGAYRPRSLQYSIFTAESPDARVPFAMRNVGYGWPGETAPRAPISAVRRDAEVRCQARSNEPPQ